MSTKTKFLSILLMLPALADGQGPPVYNIDASVIAAGGGTTAAGGFRLDGTIGQPVAGERMTGGAFTQVGGFWNPFPLSPTAASVTVSGRVLDRRGRPVNRAIVVITDTFGTARSAITNAFGYFSFNDVGAGHTYLVEVTARRFTFEATVISVSQDVSALTFIAVP